MRIYRLTVHLGNTRYYHFVTRAEAVAKKREEGGTVIDEIEFSPSKRGVAELLNDFVSLTCLNEG